ncbi:MAG: hypothetical protein KDJ16_10685, partial [Hyphomicrobiales bacterium]|nr:hypothetical protein [Hyphomicrobiales bacterium]
PEEAPLGKAAIAIVTGTAFDAAAALQAYARKNDWPELAVETWDFSTLEATFGRYARARRLLALTRDLLKQDELIVLLDNRLAELAASREKELARYLQDYPADPTDIFTLAAEAFEPDKTKHEPLFAWSRAMADAQHARESGDYDLAVRKYADARGIAGLAGLSRESVIANEGLVWSRQLHASWRDKSDPVLAAVWQSYATNRSQEISATRAEMLASHLRSAGHDEAAIAYLEEARDYCAKANPERLAYLEAEIDDLRTKQSKRVQKSTSEGRPLTLYTHAKGTEIVLDAIEYGNGDWNRSIAYLEAALAADPKSEKISVALTYVRTIAAAE